MEELEIHEQLQQILMMQEQVMMLLTHLHGNSFNDTEWIDSNDLCRMLKITERTVYRWRKQGILTPIVIGGKCYYAKQMMERFGKG